VSRRWQTEAWRRVARLAAAWLALLALLAPLSACGDSTDVAHVAPYRGSWLRIDAGEPNPDFALTVADREGVTGITFVNHADGTTQTVPATVQGGCLACVLPTGAGSTSGSGIASAAPAASGVPTDSHLELSLDDDGRLVVDLVLSDGTLQPIWIYERVRGASADPE
jgi:hypothetical protein